ncbi:MAG: DUF7674 family protein [Brevundimonas sp.]
MNAPRLQQLATLAPQLATAATESAAYWSPEPPPLTILAADLADALASNVRLLPPATLQSAFELCEAAIVDGSPEEQAAFATGFLEALQHADGREDFDFRSIASFLGAASKAHCEGMDNFHGSRTRGL